MKTQTKRTDNIERTLRLVYSNPAVPELSPAFASKVLAEAGRRAGANLQNGFARAFERISLHFAAASGLAATAFLAYFYIAGQVYDPITMAFADDAGRLSLQLLGL
ncbi:hypothetical protein [Desulfovibrio inopinatus]|uniref:hypothetical protein n=1 Tax=Desulfovibrio inopinatus TaxID=102109 RepID=UPI0003F927B9|nr:hypothetical protein [Desulfovibrio inopinatus]